MIPVSSFCPLRSIPPDVVRASRSKFTMAYLPYTFVPSVVQFTLMLPCDVFPVNGSTLRPKIEQREVLFHTSTSAIFRRPSQSQLSKMSGRKALVQPIVRCLSTASRSRALIVRRRVSRTLFSSSCRRGNGSLSGCTTTWISGWRARSSYAPTLLHASRNAEISLLCAYAGL